MGSTDKEYLSTNVNEVLDFKELDTAGGFLATIAQRPDAAELLAPFTKEEERKLLAWKIDPIIATLCQFAGMMGAVDKVCIGTAAIVGFKTDTHLVGQQFSWTSSILYFGAIVSVFPSLYIMQRAPAGKWIALNCSIWGIIVMCTAAAKNFAGLMVARFILGMFESIIFGGFGLIVAMWWKKREQPWRTAIIFSTLSSVPNALLSYAAYCYKPTAHLKQWQLLFILVGLITFLWSILLWVFLPNSPASAWWLSDRERVIAVRRTTENHTGMENKTFKWHQAAETFKDPKTYLFFLINLCLNVPNGGLVTFNSTVVASLGFTPKTTLLMAIPTGVISWISSIILALLSAYTGKRFIVTILGCLAPLIGTIVLHVVPRSNVSGSLGGLYVLWMYWGPYTNAANLMYANTGSHTKKLLTFGTAYIGYCVGNIVGPQTFKATEANRGYPSGITAMLTCYCLAIVLLGILYWYCVHLNKLKEVQLREYEASRVGKDDLLESWHDETDFENPRFRYTT